MGPADSSEGYCSVSALGGYRRAMIKICSRSMLGFVGSHVASNRYAYKILPTAIVRSNAQGAVHVPCTDDDYLQRIGLMYVNSTKLHFTMIKRSSENLMSKSSPKINQMHKIHV